MSTSVGLTVRWLDIPAVKFRETGLMAHAAVVVESGPLAGLAISGFYVYGAKVLWPDGVSASGALREAIDGAILRAYRGRRAR